MRCAFLVVGLALSCASCKSTYYRWGHYEDSVYALGSGELDYSVEIEELQEDVADAAEGERPLPPGFHMHLAFLMSRVGDFENARVHLQAEKELYPESAGFVDFYLQRFEENRSGVSE